jgi:hypothetical protein
MGTLGCINNMMRRDKENRELRKAGKERLNETKKGTPPIYPLSN